MNNQNNSSLIRNIGRIVLGLFLILAGTGHLTWARVEFLAQVPAWIPVNKDLVVILSGIVEISLGLALVLLPSRQHQVGWIVAIFFVLVFPGNIAQFMNGTNAFGLNSDLARGIRLLFQPILVIWALWSTGAWQNRKKI